MGKTVSITTLKKNDNRHKWYIFIQKEREFNIEYGASKKCSDKRWGAVLQFCIGSYNRRPQTDQVGWGWGINFAGNQKLRVTPVDWMLMLHKVIPQSVFGFSHLEEATLWIQNVIHLIRKSRSKLMLHLGRPFGYWTRGRETVKIQVCSICNYIRKHHKTGSSWWE